MPSPLCDLRAGLVSVLCYTKDRKPFIGSFRLHTGCVLRRAADGSDRRLQGEEQERPAGVELKKALSQKVSL